MRKLLLVIIFVLLLIPFAGSFTSSKVRAGCACYDPNLGHGTYCYCNGGPGYCGPPDTGPFCGCGCPDPCAGNTQCGQCSNPPCCSPSSPSGISNSSPASGSFFDNNIVPLAWSSPSSWGKGCPQSNSYQVHYSANCTGSYATITGIGTASYTLSNLQWGDKYCWYVSASNGSQAANSAVWSFTINNVPTLVSSGMTSADVCGNGISGIAAPTQNGTTNPITYSVTFNDPLIGDATFPHSYQEVWLAIVPSANTSVTPFFDNQTKDTEATVNSVAAKSKAIATKINVVNNKMYTLNTGATWDNGVGPGSNDTNSAGTASVLGFGGPTKATIAGQNITATFQIKFENSPSTFTAANYNIYVAALIKTSTGTLVTSYATAPNNRMYHRANATNTSQTWGVDLNPPSVPIANITYNTNGTFTIQDNITDNNVNDSGIKQANISGTIYATKNGAIIQNVNNNNPLPTAAPGSAFPIQVTPNNANVNKTYNLNTSLFDMTKNLHSGYNAIINAKDQACNLTSQTTQFGLPDPWLISYLGSISTAETIPDIAIPVKYNPAPTPTPSVTNPPYFSTFSAISGVALPTPPSQTSQQKESASGYANSAMLPPDGTSSWYTYMQNLVKKNYSPTILTYNPNILSNTISAHLGVAANSATPLVAQAPANTNIIIGSNTTCDEPAVIFVNGTLTIYPDFKTTSNNNGCVFIASDNITIGNILQSTVPLGSNASAQYETIQAQLVTDKIFTTLPSYNNPTYANKGVGLYLKGGVIANSISLNRDLNYVGNSGQPAEIFHFDPKYRILFKNIFGDTRYSLREVTN